MDRTAGQRVHDGAEHRGVAFAKFRPEPGGREEIVVGDDSVEH